MNLFRRLRKATKTSATPTSESMSIDLLARYTALAVKARSDYANSTHSGHPDEQLELIDYYRDMVRKLKAASANEFRVNEGTVADAEERLEWWAANTVIPTSDPRHAEGIANRTEFISWAKAGVV